MPLKEKSSGLGSITVGVWGGHAMWYVLFSERVYISEAGVWRQSHLQASSLIIDMSAHGSSQRGPFLFPSA